MLQVFQNLASISLVAFAALVVLLLIARPDRDAEGNGLYAVYLSVVNVAALYLLLSFGAIAVDSIAQGLLVDYPASDQFGSGVVGAVNMFSFGGFGAMDSADAAATSAVVAGVLAIAAGLVLVFHLRRRQELLISPGIAGSAGERVDRAYLGGVCFLVVTTGVVAAGIVAYSIMRIVAPEVTGSVRHFEEEQGAAQLIAYGLLTLVCFGIFRASFWSIRGTRDDAYDDLDDGDAELVEPT